MPHCLRTRTRYAALAAATIDFDRRDLAAYAAWVLAAVLIEPAIERRRPHARADGLPGATAR